MGADNPRGAPDRGDDGRSPHPWAARILRRREVAIHPLTLRFPNAELDRAYCTAHDRDAVTQARISGGLAIVLYAGFAILDARVVSNEIAGLYVVRFAIVCPFIALTTVAWSRRCFGPAALQILVCSQALVASVGLDVMPLIADVPDEYPRTGTMLILMFVFAFARLRYQWAAFTTAVIVVCYEAFTIVKGTTLTGTLTDNFFLIGFVVIGGSTSYALERLRRTEFLRERDLEHERARSDALLHEILPEPIAAQLRQQVQVIAESATGVSVVFADIVGFTPLAAKLKPTELVDLLDRLFTRFDALCARHGVEKVKTIGDAYMAVAGAPHPDPHHARSAALLALDMRQVAAELEPEWPTALSLRIGISSGPVVAGVIGRRKFAYDLWGDTVNIASRMESHGVPGEIQVSEATYALLADEFPFSKPREIFVKGRGMMNSYLLLGGHGPSSPTDDTIRAG